jgi:GNAT superfamily N-acetyltransferase
MPGILHLRRELRESPAVLEVPGISVRNMVLPDDVQPWLALRDRATADQTPRARSWAKSDFHSEMLIKPWWRSDRTWLAIVGERRLAGSVTLALREGAATVPVVHWLLVDPAYRRRGIARLLVSHLERAAWDAGWRGIQLGTHAGWTAAVAFYQSIGYAPIRERSPR